MCRLVRDCCLFKAPLRGQPTERSWSYPSRAQSDLILNGESLTAAAQLFNYIQQAWLWVDLDFIELFFDQWKLHQLLLALLLLLLLKLKAISPILTRFWAAAITTTTNYFKFYGLIYIIWSKIKIKLKSIKIFCIFQIQWAMSLKFCHTVKSKTKTMPKSADVL